MSLSSLTNSFSTSAGSGAPCTSAQTPPPSPGDLGKYVVRREIGRGGMGVVYEGEDTLLERSVAIKWLVPHSAEPLAVDRLLREARWAARLHHPNVVAVYDAGEHPSGVFIALELVRGQSAYDHLHRQGPFAWQDATRIAAEVCQGLAAAHAAGLIHRDIKPANILLVAAADPEKHRGAPTSDSFASQPWAKLSDFGLSRSVNYTAPATVEGQVVGTPHYMSPEQIRGEQLDQRTDLYSLGATYFTLLTGRFPYERDDVIQTLFAHCSAALPDPRTCVPTLPEACATIIARCLAKEPRNRYSSAAELLMDLQSLLAGSPLSTSGSLRIVTPTVEARSGRNANYVAAGIAAVALLLLGLPFVWNWNRHVPSVPVVAAREIPKPERPALPPEGMTVEAAWSPQQNGTFVTDGELEFLRLAPDGRTLAWGISEGEMNTGRLTLYDIQRQVVVGSYTDARHYASFSSIAFPSERYLLMAVSSRVIALDRDTNQPTTLVELKDGSARSIDVSSDGKTLALGVVEWAGGGRVELFEFVVDEDGPRLQRRCLANKEHRHPVKCVAISPDGKSVASASDEGSVLLGSLQTGVTQYEWKLPEISGDGAELGYALQFSPDGQTVAAGGHRGVVLWDVATGEQRVLPARHARGIMSLAFSQDGKFIASASTDGIRIWNLSEGWQVGKKLEGHEGNVITGMAFAREDSLLITSGFDRKIHFVNLGRLKRSVYEE
ncbi:serine/threonine-protein kinase [Anatilimnocola floriformis]|uniref:serine/threonine-protein kinase n=1 Tax=Anatilimnocola floriformis TaxID=2948575 RepID=UPI0020C47D34|nr:serine/threonine-protein kinase [Anatilimnocola floriformis]